MISSRLACAEGNRKRRGSELACPSPFSWAQIPIPPPMPSMHTSSSSEVQMQIICTLVQQGSKKLPSSSPGQADFQLCK